MREVAPRRVRAAIVAVEKSISITYSESVFIALGWVHTYNVTAYRKHRIVTVCTGLVTA